MNKFTLRRPDDFHVHFREGQMLAYVAPMTARQFARAIVMPNTKHPPIQTAIDSDTYRRQIEPCTAGFGFTPLMTIKLYPDTTPTMIMAAHDVGVVAAKLYPEGVTTNAEDGVSVSNIEVLHPAFGAMEKCGMLLLLHGEMPGVFCMLREIAFHEVVRKIAALFPKLKIVMEHITCAETVRFVNEMPDTVGATITLHHLELTLDDVVGDKCHPHNFCKPIAKSPDDRDALIKIILTRHPKFFFGSDSAPWEVCDKECADGCAGVFTASVALPRLVEFFEKIEALDRLENFTSRFGAEFYDLPLNEGTITLVHESWTVPIHRGLGGIIRPYLAGQEIRWQVKD